MALGLDGKCKKKLIEVLINMLPNIEVFNNSYLEYKTVVGLNNLDKILPESGPIHDKIRKYIGDTPLSIFIYETINRELVEKFDYDSKPKGVPLISLTNYNDQEAVAKRLINEFDSLPFDYLVSFEFPPPLGEWLREKMIKPFQLNKTMTIILPNEQCNQKYPLSTGKEAIDRGLFDSYWVLDNLGKRAVKKWNQKAAYLQVNASGFIGEYSLTPPITEVIVVLKSIFALSIVLGFISIKRKYLIRPRVRHLIIHRQINNHWKIFKTQKLPMDFIEVLDNVELCENDGQKTDGNNSQHGQMLLSSLELVLSCPVERNERLLKASQWFMDSYIGNNELLAFVQAMIAIEVLLGGQESKEVGISELISSRCAYLIGKNHDERSQILTLLKKIYNVRSSIVHRGKNALSANEKELFYDLRWLCSRVILRELQFLNEDRQQVNVTTKKPTEDKG